MSTETGRTRTGAIGSATKCLLVLLGLVCALFCSVQVDDGALSGVDRLCLLWDCGLGGQALAQVRASDARGRRLGIHSFQCTLEEYTRAKLSERGEATRGSCGSAVEGVGERVNSVRLWRLRVCDDGA